MSIHELSVFYGVHLSVLFVYMIVHSGCITLLFFSFDNYIDVSFMNDCSGIAKQTHYPSLLCADFDMKVCADSFLCTSVSWVGSNSSCLKCGCAFMCVM